MKELDASGRPKYQKVTVGGRKFISDPQLIAASQDFEQAMKGMPDCNFEVIGDGMVAHVWSLTKPGKGSFSALMSK